MIATILENFSNKMSPHETLLFFLPSIYFCVLRFAHGECIGGCSEPVLLYESLKCQPLYATPSDCCPKQFDCAHIKSRDDGQCHFKRRSYRVGEHINDSEIYGNCLIDCTCVHRRSGRKGFGCSNLDCREWLRLEPREGCHFKYELNKCCNTGEICPPFDFQCDVNGTFHKEGVFFPSPHDKCTECLCKRGFRGKFDSSSCRKIECLDEISNVFDVKNYCAPSYKSTDDCCPTQWICPNSNDIIQLGAGTLQSGGPKCKFGDKRLSIGDKLDRIHSRSGGKVVCECRIPPYLTCIQDGKYPVYPRDYH